MSPQINSDNVKFCIRVRLGVESGNDSSYLILIMAGFTRKTGFFYAPMVESFTLNVCFKGTHDTVFWRANIARLMGI